MVVVKLNHKAESPRDRRLRDAGDPRQPGEEDLLITHASTPLMRDLIIAGISTGMRLGELLSLQWREVEHAANAKGEQVAVALHLSADKTKDSDPRRVPVGAKLAAVLAMRRHGPDGKALKLDTYVFGNEVGEPVKSVKRAWGDDEAQGARLHADLDQGQ